VTGNAASRLAVGVPRPLKSEPGHEVCAHMSIYGAGRDFLAHASGYRWFDGAEMSIYGASDRSRSHSPHPDPLPEGEGATTGESRGWAPVILQFAFFNLQFEIHARRPPLAPPYEGGEDLLHAARGLSCARK